MIMRYLQRIIAMIKWLIVMWPDGPRYLRYKKKYDIHRTFGFGGHDILFYGEGEICCGEGSYIGRYSQILSWEGCKVRIGKSCAISHFVKIYTMSNEADQDFSMPASQRRVKQGDVNIGNYAWIGASVFINPGVDIGENTVIGANSVVTRSIPPHSIAAGVPAKVIKFKHYIDETIKRELITRYWDCLSEKLRIKYSHFKPKA